MTETPSPTRTRIAGLDRDQVVTDCFVVADFIEFASENALLVAKKWPGGLYPLRDDEWVRVGSKRLSDGTWQAPAPPLYRMLLEVDQRAARSFENGFGFQHGDHAFSLSLASQSSIRAAYDMRDQLSWPRPWSTLGNDVVQIDRNDIEAMYAAMCLAVISIRDEAATAKEALHRQSGR